MVVPDLVVEGAGLGHAGGLYSFETVSQ
jgi:hypothetical protein